MGKKFVDNNSYLLELWNVVIIILTLFIVIELPFRLAYDYNLTNIFVEVAITIVLFVDAFINLNSQTCSKGILIKKHKQIERHYLRKFFIFDLLAAIPFLLFSLIFPWLILLKWLSLTRLFKLLRLNTLIANWRNRYVINPSILRLGIFFFWILLIAHWIACIWIYIARIDKLDTIPTYLDSIYWCITTITTVGYGDIRPITDFQKILTMVAMFLGVAVYGYVIGNVASLLSNIDVAKASFSKKMEDINSFLSYKSVPKRLKQKVHDYYHYVWHNQMALSEHELLSNLPSSLKTEISLHIHRQLIEHVPFFNNTDKDFISEIISQLQPRVFLPGDLILKKGEIGNSMYFICNGAIDVLSVDETSVIATLNEGDYFGEISLIKKVVRARSVIAKEYCYLYALGKKNFDNLLEKYPKFKTHIHETIKKRQAST